MAKEYKRINPFTASLEELEEALRLAMTDSDDCKDKSCNDCASSAHCVLQEECFGVSLRGFNCGGVRGLFRVLIAQKKQNAPDIQDNQKSPAPTCNGRCENCKWLDSDLLKKSGYTFCKHWHNFTISEGFCYAYEAVENPEKPVDNSV